MLYELLDRLTFPVHCLVWLKLFLYTVNMSFSKTLKSFQYMLLLRQPVLKMNTSPCYSYSTGLGDLGSGAGQGGGDGGSVRQAGGSIGKREAAFEGEYFNRLQKQQLDELKKSMHDELAFHQEQVKRHEEAMKRIKERITKAE